MFNPPPYPNNSMANLRARLRPMGIGDILDETFSLYRDNFGLFLATIAVIEVPLQIIIVLFSLSVANASPSTSQPGVASTAATSTVSTGAAIGLGIFGLALAIITIVAYTMMTAALAIVISNRYLGRAATVGDAYRGSLSRIGALILAGIWVGVRVILLALACVVLIGIPFLIYFAVAWTLVSQVIVLEGVGGFAASGRSRELVKGFWWKTLGLVLVTGLLVTILSAVIPSIIGGIVQAAIPSAAVRVIVNGIVGLIIGLLVQPVQFIATTLLFYDLKIRKEAFDLEAMISQVGAPPPPPYAPR
jgi:hypothetical protein